MSAVTYEAGEAVEIQSASRGLAFQIRNFVENDPDTGGAFEDGRVWKNGGSEYGQDQCNRRTITLSSPPSILDIGF